MRHEIRVQVLGQPGGGFLILVASLRPEHDSHPQRRLRTLEPANQEPGVLDGIPVQEADHDSVDGCELKVANARGFDIGKARLRRCRALDLQHLCQHRGGGIVEFAAPAGAKHRHVRAIRQVGLILASGPAVVVHLPGNDWAVLLVRFLLCVLVEVGHQRQGTGRHLPSLQVAHHAAHAIPLAQQKCGNGYLVVEFDQIFLLQHLLGVVGCFVGITSQKPLVEPRMRLEHGFVAKQHVKEFKLRHMPAQHHQADGERR